KRISASFEKPKIILIVRNPIDRAISNYRFSVHHGLETLPMEEAFRREHGRIDNYDKNQVSISPFAYLSRGKYIDHISVYDRYFPRNQFKIIVFEELIRDVRVIQEIYSFLEVDSNFTSKHAEDAVNSSPGGDQELSSGLRHWLNDYFAESNYQLSLRLNRSMEIWNCVKEGD
ncbi:MAG: sulfotransferase domain-containing protein, partial [Planctomycetota bacterium]